MSNPKVCFTSGIKRHINTNCPNRRSERAMMSSRARNVIAVFRRFIRLMSVLCPCRSSLPCIHLNEISPPSKPLLARQLKSRCFIQECPTWWQIYEYLSEAQQRATLERRLENKGSEAYIVDDQCAIVVVGWSIG
ncbi:hypothetical protein BJ165DRAFT_1509101 [Panaeolus papilionaceus]|nr:hypothetical protein BJ165DRAFT_1509101 [Panaeolus papilionaceus]